MGVGTCENGIVRAHGAAAVGPIVNFDTVRVPHHIERRCKERARARRRLCILSVAEAKLLLSQAGRRRRRRSKPGRDETASNLILINPSLKTLTNSFCRRRRSHCYC
jgi:hypothetical protein